jgi:hypothetical protein
MSVHELLARHVGEDGEIIGPAAALAADVRTAWNELRFSDTDLGDYDDIIETLIRLGAALASDTVTHRYISTACLHAAEPRRHPVYAAWLHHRCRQQCKWCPVLCLCHCHGRTA